MAQKILYLVSEDWYFVSHRLPMARAAKQAGFEVHVATRVAADGQAIQREGFILHPLCWRRGSLDPLHLLGAAHEVRSLYRQVQPELAHHVALLPTLVGSIAALGLPIRLSQCCRRPWLRIYLTHAEGSLHPLHDCATAAMAAPAQSKHRVSAEPGRPRSHPIARGKRREDRADSRIRRQHRCADAPSRAAAPGCRGLCRPVAPRQRPPHAGRGPRAACEPRPTG